jgi:hypothetical protein
MPAGREQRGKGHVPPVQFRRVTPLRDHNLFGLRLAVGGLLARPCHFYLATRGYLLRAVRREAARHYRRLLLGVSRRNSAGVADMEVILDSRGGERRTCRVSGGRLDCRTSPYGGER